MALFLVPLTYPNNASSQDRVNNKASASESNWLMWTTLYTSAAKAVFRTIPHAGLHRERLDLCGCKRERLVPLCSQSPKPHDELIICTKQTKAMLTRMQGNPHVFVQRAAYDAKEQTGCCFLGSVARFLGSPDRQHRKRHHVTSTTWERSASSSTSITKTHPYIWRLDSPSCIAKRYRTRDRITPLPSSSP